MTNFQTPLRRIPELDGLRGLAILFVLLWHYGACCWNIQNGFLSKVAIKSLGLAWSGVDLFFVLSGFLIGGILLDNRQSPNYFKAFYVRRSCRILPLYYCWLLCFIVLAPVAARLLPEVAFNWLFGKPLALWSYATFSQNIMMAIQGTTGPHWMDITWSLAVEEQFYLTLPFLIRFVPPRRLLPVLLCLLAATPLLRFAFLCLDRHAGGVSAYVLMPCRMDALLSGVVCAYFFRQEGFIKRHLPQPVLTKMLAILLAGAVILLIGPPRTELFRTPILVHLWVSLSYLWLALLYGCVLLIAVTQEKGVITTITRQPWLQRLGGIAYGVYLFHQGILGLSHGLILKQSPQLQKPVDYLVTLGSLFVTLLLAHFSWVYFEKRVVAWGHSARYNESRPSQEPSRTPI